MKRAQFILGMILSLAMMPAWSAPSHVPVQKRVATKVNAKKVKANSNAVKPLKATKTPISGGQFSSAGVRTVDRVVAVVNRSVITERGLNARVLQATKNLQQQKIPMPDGATLRAQVLERMILEESLMQHALSLGLSVPDSVVDATVTRLARSNQLSVDEFRNRLARESHLSFDAFRDDIRREMLIQEMREREVNSKIHVSDAEVDAWLAQQSHAQNEYRLAHILVSVSDQADSARLDQRARRMQQALSQLDAGKSFAQVAANFSDAPEALKSGELGWVSAARLPSQIAQELARLKVGERSQVIRTASGFHVFKLLDRRTQAAMPVQEQISARHILVRVGEKQNEHEARAKIQSILKEISGGQNFEDMARRYSEDGSASRGGDLGWVQRGETLPEFEQALFALKSGEMSAPVRTAFGWHLILAGERRKHSGNEHYREQVRQELRMRKSEELFQEWQSQVRDSSYVENYLDDAQ